MKKKDLKSFDIASYDIEIEYNSKIAPITKKITKLNKSHETKSLKAHKDFLTKEKQSTEKLKVLDEKAVLKDQRIEKAVENKLVKADITINKNMVPFDSRSPFQTSGLRVGTPAITTRGLKEEHMEPIVALIDEVISNIEDEKVIDSVRKRVNDMMKDFPLFAY